MFALMIFGTEGISVQVEFVMRQNQVWSIQGSIKIPSRKAMITLRSELGGMKPKSMNGRFGAITDILTVIWNSIIWQWQRREVLR